MPRFELKTGEDRTAEESNNVQNIYGRGCLQRQAFPLPFFQSGALQPRRCWPSPIRTRAMQRRIASFSSDAACALLRRGRAPLPASFSRPSHGRPACLPLYKYRVLQLQDRFKGLAAECRQKRFSTV